MTNQAAQARDDALAVLRDVLEWSLTPAGWRDVEEAIGGLESGLDPAGPDQLFAFSQATVRLELAAPARITRIDRPAILAPDRIRERVNHLIHELERPADAGVPDGDSARPQ